MLGYTADREAALARARIRLEHGALIRVRASKRETISSALSALSPKGEQLSLLPFNPATPVPQRRSTDRSAALDLLRGALASEGMHLVSIEIEPLTPKRERIVF